jgi:hypothetical protein
MPVTYASRRATCAFFMERHHHTRPFLFSAFQFLDQTGMGVCLVAVDVDDRWTKLGDTAQCQHETARSGASASFLTVSDHRAPVCDRPQQFTCELDWTIHMLITTTDGAVEARSSL